MKYKSKFKRVKAQAGVEDVLNPDMGTQYFNTGYDEFGNSVGYNPMDYSYEGAEKAEQFTTTNPVQFPGTNNQERFSIKTRYFKENPYVKAFNIAASEATGIANMIQNNRLKKQERRQILHSLEPRYLQNMEAEGLNNIPMYTQYGGFGPNMDEPGFAHSAFYGDNTVYKYGGMPKYAAGGMTNVYGLPDELKYFADVEAEAGEVIERQNGGIVKVADDGNTHEQGGEMIPGVRRVLEDTGDKRKDLASKILKVKPEVIQEVFGFKPKTAVTHAKAYELITAELKKTHQLYTDSRKNSNMKPQMDKTAINTLRLNEMFQGQLPTEQEVFELLFNHQEGVKAQAGINDDGSIMKYGGTKKAQTGTIDENTKKEAAEKAKKIDKEEGWTFLYEENGKKYYSNVKTGQVKVGTKLNIKKGGANFTTDDILNNPEKYKTFHNRMKNAPDDVKRKAAENLLKKGIMPDIYEPYSITEYGYMESPTLSKISDNVEKPIVDKNSLNTGVKVNPKFVKQPDNSFYEPTYWSDIAAPFAGLVDSFRRWPELYNPMEFNQLRYKMLDPTAALTANQADFNAAVATTNEFGNSGAANANKATLLGQKYRANNQVMSQYDNQNTQIKNNEITYNTQVRDKQSVADAQSREKFYTNVLLGREAQRQQFLTSLSQLARADQLKRRQNTSGNLLLKLSPAFDQFGEYNGYQYLPYLDPAVVNYNDQTVQPAKVSSKNTNTQNVTTWKDASGRVHKTTTTE